MASSSALLKGIDAVLVHPSFFTGSVVAEDALQAAKLLKQWCIREENNEVVIGFTYELLSDLQGALVFPCGRLPQQRKDMAAIFRCSVIKYFHITVDGFLGTSKC